MEERINMERWTKEEILFLKENYKTMSYKDIGKVIGKTDAQIRTRCFRDGLVKNNEWKQEDIDFVKTYYNDMSTKDIARILNRTVNAVQLKAERLGLKKSPYSCNHRFFQNIDTEDKAYWLGFIYADGWITKRSYCDSGVLGIELQAADVIHLKKFNKSICGNYQIMFRERECNLHGSSKLNKMCEIKINSKDMYYDLINIGVTSDKSYTMQLPDIPNELMRHFIRGYFDGDGCLYMKHTKKSINQRCSFYSVSSDFINGLRKYLYEECSINSYVYQRDPQQDGYKICNVLEIGGGKYTDIFLDYIYKDANIYLDRKYKKYLSIK